MVPTRQPPRGPKHRPSTLSRAERLNRAMWNRQSAEYDRKHRQSLSRSGGMSWGFWRIPESRLRLLGDVRGKRILELGCGAGRWSIGLALHGAHPVGVDLSRSQLHQAARLRVRADVPLPLVLASIQRLPFVDQSFDIAFCDWGGLTFADPLWAIPEAGRILRPGGRLVFATSSPWRTVIQSRTSYGMGRRLKYPYFGLHRIAYPREVNFQLTYGGWIELFRSSGFTVERLVELPTPRHPLTSYLGLRELEFGRSWPLESIWVLARDRVPRRTSTRPRRR
ncbi:MAG TPA: class I SAM-dependent methyltransferase [Thermoplasmata archaeon]|nr:class I SAM-dependent methyltransferase [Thermoplasmata archaeon]